jgi:hypothetical protein
MSISRKPLRNCRFSALLLLTMCGWSSAFAQITPSADALTYSGSPSTNYGASALLNVTNTQTTYIQFDLASIPTGAVVGQATLKLYVNAVTTAGSFDVNYVGGSWSESALDYSNAPPLGSAIVSNVAVTAANQYILINITPAVVAWLNGSQANDGIALVANGAFHANFDSKENTTTSHPAELDIVFAGGTGTITGVIAGTGLSGGGSSGNVTLTNTGVLRLKAGTGVTVGSGQTPTVSISSAVPLLAASNTFTGDQTVNGNLSATGVVTGSGFQIGSNLFAFGSYSAGNAFLGFAGNTTLTGTANTASGFGAFQSNTTGSSNSANGAFALRNNTSGTYNTVSGYIAMVSNTTGGNNTANGSAAMEENATGSQNTAIGSAALSSNVSGSFNTATGNAAMLRNGIGNYNTATGNFALGNGSLGNYNTAAGNYALSNNTTGSYNIGIGNNAGTNAPVGNSNSIYLGSSGTTSDASGTIQIGTQGTQTGGTYIAGVSGASVPSGVPVYVNSNGQLGTVLSSRRFKDQIADMGDSSSKLLQLRPVTYFYKPEYDDGSHLLQYGLIAEEVAKVYPEMVAYDNDGRILTVKYQLLAPMLLNEVQKQNETIRQLEARLAALENLLSKVPTAATTGQ